MDTIGMDNVEELKVVDKKVQAGVGEATKKPAPLVITNAVEAMMRRKESLNNITNNNNKSAGGNSPRLTRALTKPASGRWNCLCSPTTHAGSFRCRFHRTPGSGMLRGGSIGSNLSELAAKSRTISDLI